MPYSGSGWAQRWGTIQIRECLHGVPADAHETGDSSLSSLMACRLMREVCSAVDVVSHWTWTFTLLQSSTEAFKYGACGPFW